MLRPVEYAKRYWNLEVLLSAGGSVRVHVDRYHIGEPDAAQGRLWSRLKEHFKREQHKNPAYHPGDTQGHPRRPLRVCA
jgi:hypothetical protein